jgi:hypothetical protein
MMRVVVSVAVVFLLSIGGGAASVWYVLDHVPGFNRLSIAPWTAFPLRGTPEADPYSKARFSRNAELPLGQAEGLSFAAAVDSSGAALRRECSYRIEGRVPAARFWTLYASRDGVAPIELPAGLRSGLHSQQVLRRNDDSFELEADDRPRPGNWLATSGRGPMVLVLTLYDAPAVNNPDIAQVGLPQIYRTACDV